MTTYTTFDYANAHIWICIFNWWQIKYSSLYNSFLWPINNPSLYNVFLWPINNVFTYNVFLWPKNKSSFYNAMKPSKVYMLNESHCTLHKLDLHHFKSLSIEFWIIYGGNVSLQTAPFIWPRPRQLNYIKAPLWNVRNVLTVPTSVDEALCKFQ